jgi:anti-sigma-K factor RskA
MNEPLTPEAIAALTAGYVIGDLDRAEAEVFDRLLAESPELQAEVKQLETTLDRVIYGLNAVEPPPQLQAKIVAAANNLVSPSPRESRFRWRTAIGSVAALLILYLGVDNYRLRQDFRIAGDIKTLLEQPQTQFFSLQAATKSDRATGSFIVNLGQRQGVLAAQNLAAPAPGKFYRLWAIVDGETIPCGTVQISPQGKVIDKFWMPADFYQGISGLFVTAESSETSRYPTGSIVMQSRRLATRA